jgi:hypothetical protein
MKRIVKKGNLLIEVFIYLYVTTLILVIIFNILVVISKEYNSFKIESKITSELLGADITLKSRIECAYVDSIGKEKDSLVIRFVTVTSGGNKIAYKDVVFLNKTSGKLDIYHYIGENGYLNSNKLIDNVSNFNVIEKGNLIYLKINVKNYGEKIFAYEKK